MGSESAVFLRDQGSGCNIFVGLGIKVCHTFGIKDQKFEYKNEISDEKTYLVTTLGFMKTMLQTRPVGATFPVDHSWLMSNFHLAFSYSKSPKSAI